MAAVKINELHKSDLPWIVEYDESKCIQCGKCTAVCSFNAISPAVEFRKLSNSITQKGKKEKVLVIKQNVSLENYCRGCGMCTNVCPNGAIKLIRNKDDKYSVAYRANKADSFKKGGRSNLNTEGRTLDKIKVGRISQMTDPSLDAQRHTFELKTPFGRVLKADKLNFDVKDGNIIETKQLPPNRWIYPIIFGDMSIGAVSWRMWEAMAIATAYLNEVMGIPIRMCTGEGGIPTKLLKSRYVKYMILQIASGHFGWNRIIKSMPEMTEDPAGILIKIGQGAKPGIGGHLPGEKVNVEVSNARMIPEGSDAISPAPHHDIYSIEDLRQLIWSLKQATHNKKPVSVKIAAVHNIAAIASGVARAGADIVVIDGFRGGTGAAPTRIRDNVGIPIELALASADQRLRDEGIRSTVSLVAAGSFRCSADIVKAIALGADACYVASAPLIAMGCHMCQTCNTGKCNWGIATQRPELTRRLNPEIAHQRVINLINAWNHEIKEIMGGMGINSIDSLRGNRLMLRGIGLSDKELEILGIKHAGE